jgi:hypothetical protein
MHSLNGLQIILCSTALERQSRNLLAGRLVLEDLSYTVLLKIAEFVLICIHETVF